MGSRPVFGIAAAASLAAFAVAAGTDSLTIFAAAAGVGGGALGALGFYHITQTAAVRVSPGAEHRAIAVLTIWGAFASAIYLPLAAWLVEAVGWRDTLRILTGSAVFALVLAFVLVPAPGGGETSSGSIFSELAETLRRPAAWRFVAATALAGIGASVILVYQVPAMTAAGLPLTTASFMAGFRGFAQLGGRIPITPIVARLGTAGSIRLAYGAIAVGTGFLAVAGTVWLAVLYALAAGFGIGAMSPLQGMYAQELFGAASLGTAMGLLSFVFGVVGSAGPATAGWVAEATGSRAWPVAGAALLSIAAALLIRSPAAGEPAAG